MNFELIECVFIILFTILLLFPYLCWYDFLSFECVLYNVIGCNFDIM